MCGIAGVFHRDERVDLGRLHHMSALLRHRGPHDEGMVLIDAAGGQTLTLGGADTPADVFSSGLRFAPGRHEGETRSATFHVGLAHRRLSIVDLTPTGHQPMCGTSGEAWIVYNGEIYNHVELRQELEKLGETFVGTSDTEVILASYRRWGLECLDRFNGMFAFALWDAKERRLFCARDRFGVKPFYYEWNGRRFAFASEPRVLALTQSRRIAPRLPAVRDLIALDWVDHDAHTFFEGIEQLPPGHLLTVGPGGFQMRRWWSLDSEARATGNPTQWEEQFRELFDSSVRLRLRADVEVGSCLSGGLDSSAVVTTMAPMIDRPVHAFTCAYDEGPEFDERPYVRTVIEATKAQSHVVVPDGRDFWATFDAMAWSQGEPTAGPGVFSQWKVMELAHAHGLRVLLDGQGGDETLGGYFRYLPLRLRDQLTRGDFGGFLNTLGPVADRLGLVHTLALTVEPWLPSGMIANLRRQFGQGKDRVMTNRLRKAQGSEPPRAGGSFETAMRRQQAFDLLQRLLPSLLRYEDRNSMAFSIETRLPFLDYRLVEFLFSLPDTALLEGVTTKRILRRALGDRIPASVLERHDKMGFETPADVWLRGKESGELKRRLLTRSPLHEFLEPAVMAAELDEYLEGRRATGLQVWRWLALESWMRQYLEKDARVIDRPEPVYLHPGLHLNYVETQQQLDREYEGVAAS